MVSGINRTELESSVFEKEGYLKYVTFKSDKPLTGRLEIVNVTTGKQNIILMCLVFGLYRCARAKVYKSGNKNTLTTEICLNLMKRERGL